MSYNAGTTSSESTVDKKAGNGQLRQEHYNKMAIIDIKDEMILSQMSGTMAQPKNQGKEVVKHRYIAILDDQNEVANSGLDALGVASNGNLYGSSRGMGFISAKMPDLGEDSARVNKVSYSRKEVRGSIVNRGIFYEWTKDEMNFDSDPKLKSHITTEAVRAANQINEDVLAIELINGAGVVYYAGDANSVGTVDKSCVPTLQDLIRIDTELDNNKCPKDTTIIAGSNLIDTRTVQAARFMFISPDMKMDFMSIKALNGSDDAFVPVEQYAKADKNGKYVTAIHGEIGKVGPFRIVVHPKMVKYSTDTDSASGALFGVETKLFTLVGETDALVTGETTLAGTVVYNVTTAATLTLTTDYTISGGTVKMVNTAASTAGDVIRVTYTDDGTSAGFRNDGTNYEVYANLVVGSGSFTHIGFEFGAGTQGKFNVTHKTPEELRTRDNPYAKFGMTVIEFWNGVLIERPEWIANFVTASKY